MYWAGYEFKKATIISATDDPAVHEAFKAKMNSMSDSDVDKVLKKFKK